MIPQLTRPKDWNKYYNVIASGGINTGTPNKKRIEKGLTALPNCVSYAIGRFNEIGKYNAIKYLGPYYPYAMIGVAKRQGLKVSKEPTIGGCMVWIGGPTGEGHVDIVEVIERDSDYNIKSIITSDSEYYGKAFVTFKRTIGDGNWAKGCSWMYKASTPYIYQGCIINPATEEEMEYDEFKKYMKKYEKEVKELPASTKYALEALKWAKDKGLIVGDEKGNTMPRAPLTREQFIMILYGMLKEDD